MSPDEFIRFLDAWTERRGPLDIDVPRDFTMTTAGEIFALGRAMREGDLFTTKRGTPPLRKLVGWIQGATPNDALIDAMRTELLPLLRRVVEDYLANSSSCDGDTLLFVLKVAAIFNDAADAQLIARVARAPQLQDEFLWDVVFDLVAECDDAVAVCDELREPLPDGFVGVAYLDFANRLARRGQINRHPFDVATGHARLTAHLADTDPENFSYAVSAIAAAPFISASAREELFRLADECGDPRVRLEAAWARAKVGDEDGKRALAAFCINPQHAAKALRYLEELGLDDRVPPVARDPNFLAAATMCDWLSHPNEYGAPPREITLYDTRELRWPPTNDRRRLWLFKYSYDVEGDREEGETGIGLVGSMTFSMFDEVDANMSPEDVYGLHCCLELEVDNDRRRPKERSAAYGRMLLAKENPGFQT